MATRSLSDISASVTIVLQDPFAVQVRRTSVMLGILSILQGAGAVLTWNVKFNTRTTAGAYAEGADMDDADYSSDDKQPAVLSWASYREGAKVSGLAQAAQASVGGGSLFNEDIQDAVTSLVKDFSADLYGGDPTASPTELAGAAIAIDSDTGSTFASINPATYGDWVSGEASIAAADLSVQKIREHLFRPVKTAKKRLPDLVTCPGDVFDTLLGIVGEQAQTDTIYLDGNEIHPRAQFGARALLIDGVPFVEDEDCTASTMYAWTLNDVQVVQLPSADMQTADDGIFGMGVSAEAIAETLRDMFGIEDISVADVKARLAERVGQLLPTVEILAKTGDAHKAQIKIYAQIRWRSRNGFSKLILT